MNGHGKERVMAGTEPATPERRARRPDQPAALVRRLVEEACNDGNLSILDELLPSIRSAGAAARLGGVCLRQVLPAFRTAVPDARWQIVDLIAAGNTVVTRLSVQGTFSGALVGRAPPGRPATLSGVAISRFAHGCLVDLWLQADLLGFLQQLGVLPALDLDQVVAMARVLHAGALLADGPAP
jgi:predicted ester cyclase